VILRNDQDKLLDSITIATILNQGHETAKADQYFNPNAVRIESFNTDHMSLATQRAYAHLQDPVVKAKAIRQANLKFYALL
jgi:hypothetical protein